MSRRIVNITLDNLGDLPPKCRKCVFWELGEFTGGGIGRMLVQAMAKDLTRRGVKAIEAFGDRRWESPACMLPVDYLLAVGFKTIRPHHHYPRLRMDLRTVLTWREDVEVALERLLGSMTPAAPAGALRPV